MLQVIAFFLASIIGRIFLARIIGRKWKMFEETCMKNTDLTLSPVPAALVAQTQQRLVEEDPECLCTLDQGHQSVPADCR